MTYGAPSQMEYSNFKKVTFTLTIILNIRMPRFLSIFFFTFSVEKFEPIRRELLIYDNRMIIKKIRNGPSIIFY